MNRSAKLNLETRQAYVCLTNFLSEEKRLARDYSTREKSVIENVK